MGESATGNGYVQGSPSLSEGEVRRMAIEEERFRAEKVRRAGERICTCKGSPFGMDVERCPEHGTFYTTPG